MYGNNAYKVFKKMEAENGNAFQFRKKMIEKSAKIIAEKIAACPAYEWQEQADKIKSILRKWNFGKKFLRELSTESIQNVYSGTKKSELENIKNAYEKKRRKILAKVNRKRELIENILTEVAQKSEACKNQEKFRKFGRPNNDTMTEKYKKIVTAHLLQGMNIPHSKSKDLNQLRF